MSSLFHQRDEKVGSGLLLLHCFKGTVACISAYALDSNFEQYLGPRSVAAGESRDNKHPTALTHDP